MQHDFVLLDRSGSMISLWVEALNSVNNYTKKLADQKVDTGVTLMVFDTPQDDGVFEIVRDRIIPTTWKAVTDDEIHPRGWTPLNDAIGRIVNLARAGNYDKVAIIIMTDGKENRSRELTREQAKQLLDDCRARGWQVIFLGANFDNTEQAKSYGAASEQTVQSSVRNLNATMDHLAVGRAAYASIGASMGFTAEEKKALKK